MGDIESQFQGIVAAADDGAFEQWLLVPEDAEHDASLGTNLRVDAKRRGERLEVAVQGVFQGRAGVNADAPCIAASAQAHRPPADTLVHSRRVVAVQE